MTSTQVAVRGLTLDLGSRRLLNDVTFSAESGTCLAIVGPSGSGKTSLLNCIGGITVPTSGDIDVNGLSVSSLKIGKRTAFRLRNIGVIFQFGELLPEMTAIENVALPNRLLGMSIQQAESRATSWLSRLDVEELATAYPDVLSGGEAQRVAIARALAHEPILVLADEPTGALDETNSSSIASLLTDLAHESDTTVLIVTHDPLVADKSDRILMLREGCIHPDEER